MSGKLDVQVRICRLLKSSQADVSLLIISPGGVIQGMPWSLADKPDDMLDTA